LPFGGKGAKTCSAFPNLAGFNVTMAQSPLEIGGVQQQTRKRGITEDAAPTRKKLHVDTSSSQGFNPRVTSFKPSTSSNGKGEKKRRPVASKLFDLAPDSESMRKSNKKALLEFENKMKAEIMEHEASKSQKAKEKQRLEEVILMIEKKAQEEAALKAEIKKKAQEEAALKALEKKAKEKAILRAQVEKKAKKVAAVKAWIVKRARKEAAVKAEIRKKA
jgi:hypothetical protein